MSIRGPRLVNNDFLIETGLEVLVEEIFDELAAKGWAAWTRRDPIGGHIRWTEEGIANGALQLDLIEELRKRVVRLPARRRIEILKAMQQSRGVT